MRRYTLSCLVPVLLAASLLAQDVRKAEIFGGYQFARFSDGIDPNKFNGNGWNVGFAYHFKPWIGAKADFGGAYTTDSRSSFQPFKVDLYTYTFGPVVSVPAAGRVTPFGEFLFGRYHETLAGYTTADSGFAMLAGGGVDVKLGEHFSVRAVQADWVYTRPPNPASLLQPNNLRLVVGVIFAF